MFRGRSPKRAVTLDPSASATVDALIARAGVEFERTIAHPATPEDLAAAGRSFLEGRARGDGAVDVLGAAVAWMVLTDQPENAFKVTFLDELVARYGAASAAEAAVVVAGLRTRFHRPGPGEPMVAIRSVERRPVEDLLNVHVFEPHSRLRDLLAVSTDSEYAAAVSALGRIAYAEEWRRCRMSVATECMSYDYELAICTRVGDESGTVAHFRRCLIATELVAAAGRGERSRPAGCWVRDRSDACRTRTLLAQDVFGCILSALDGGGFVRLAWFFRASCRPAGPFLQDIVGCRCGCEADDDECHQ